MLLKLPAVLKFGLINFCILLDKEYWNFFYPKKEKEKEKNTGIFFF